MNALLRDGGDGGVAMAVAQVGALWVAPCEESVTWLDLPHACELD